MSDDANVSCEPPPGARHLRYHWLRLRDNAPVVHQWRSSPTCCWSFPAFDITPEAAAQHGWRYIEPIREPILVESGEQSR